jgi:hypothetical protein
MELVDIADLKSYFTIFHNFRNSVKNQPKPIISSIYAHLSVVGNSGYSVCSCTNTALLPHYTIEGDAAGNLPLFCYVAKKQTTYTISLVCLRIIWCKLVLVSETKRLFVCTMKGEEHA